MKKTSINTPLQSKLNNFLLNPHQINNPQYQNCQYEFTLDECLQLQEIANIVKLDDTKLACLNFFLGLRKAPEPVEIVECSAEDLAEDLANASVARNMFT